MTPLSWRTGTVTANGLRLAWEETGDPSGEPLLLVMGLAAQCILWPEPLCRDLAQRGFRVIRFDNRDIGLSEGVPRRMRIRMPVDFFRARAGLRVRAHYTLHDMVDDTVGLMDGLGVARAHLVGVSMGGLISQLLAARRPERVASLTSIMSHTCHPFYTLPRASLLWRLSGAGIRDRSRAAVVRRQIATYRAIGSPTYARPESELREVFERAYDRDYRPGGIIRQTHAIMATPCFEELLPRITAPTLVIHGTADPLVPPVNGRRCARLIPGARLEIIPGMGHDLPAPLLPRFAELIAVIAGPPRGAQPGPHR
jgi:pimeloyl-ACP methyl ester carboxylesterase